MMRLIMIDTISPTVPHGKQCRGTAVVIVRKCFVMMRVLRWMRSQVMRWKVACKIKFYMRTHYRYRVVNIDE